MGFKEQFEYAANFSFLESGRLDAGQEQEFVSKWKNIYQKHLMDSDVLEKCYLGIRLYRAKKEIFCSAQMYTEAVAAQKCGCMTAFYFLCYYALMHSMEGVLFLNPYIEDEKVLCLAHRNVQKYFEDYYCKGKRSVFSGEMIYMLEKLRTCREYYSYTMPWNLGEYEKVDMDKLRQHLSECFQLINLKGMILYSVSRGIKVPEEKQVEVISYFANCCCKLNPDTRKLLMDEADENMLNESLRCGIDYCPPSITFEHDFDEYGGYDFRQLVGQQMGNIDEIRRETLKMIYHILL